MSSAGALGGRRLVLAAAMAPSAWLVHLAAMPALVPLACETGAHWPMTAVTAACAAVAASGIVLLYRARSLLGSVGSDPSGDAARQRGRLWSGSGLITGWLFLVLIVVEYLPTFVVDPCPV